MPKPRGREHSSLTETATLVVRELQKFPNIKMIAPGEIRKNSRASGTRYITIVHTAPGCELLISGQSTQKVSVHGNNLDNLAVYLRDSKRLKHFIVKERERKPGI